MKCFTALGCAIVAAGFLVAPAMADVVVNYTVDAGGTSGGPLNGLAARVTWSISGTTLTVVMENTSTGVPDDFTAAASLLVSVGFNLAEGVSILTGDSAVIGAGSVGLGTWSDRVAGDSVAEEWLWTNEFGADLLLPFAQVISTSSGQGSGDHMRFDGVFNGDVDGPFGGIAADPPIIGLPPNRPAASDSLSFSLTLSDIISEDDLSDMARSAMVEFGSDARYLRAPAPGGLAMLAIAGLARRRRRDQ